MPSGGVISQGSGLRLQVAFPGTQDTGNANISGVLRAGQLTTTDPAWIGTNITGENIGHDNQWLGGATFPACSAAVFGIFNQIYNSNSNGAAFGKNNYLASNVGGCVFGLNSTAGNPTSLPVASVAFGLSCNAGATNDGTDTAPNSIAFGSNLTIKNSSVGFGYQVTLQNDNTANHDQIGIGNTLSGINPTGQNVLLGRGISTTHTNTLIIGWFNANQPVDVDNAIVIGNQNQPLIRLGPYLIQNGLATTQFTMIGNATVANTVAETTLIGAINGSTTIPANRLTAGATVRIRLRGVIADTLTPTIRFRAYIGATAYIDTGAVALVALGGTQSWTFEGEITIRTTGAGGTALGNGHVEFSLATQADMDSLNVAASAIDTTVAQTVNWTVQWGTAAPANTITNTIGTCEIVG